MVSRNSHTEARGAHGKLQQTSKKTRFDSWMAFLLPQAAPMTLLQHMTPFQTRYMLIPGHGVPTNGLTHKSMSGQSP